MPRGVQIYQFARLNLLGQWDDKHVFVSDALASGATESKGKFKYGFFDLEEVELESEMFAFGRLVKYKPLLEGETVDERLHQVVEGGLPQGVVAKSEFLLHYDSDVIAYRPVASRLSPAQFREMAAKLIELAHDRFFVSAEVQSIDEGFEIEEAIREFEEITKVSLDLHPSNPSNREVWERIDRRLTELGAIRMWQTLIARQGGFDRTTFFDDDVYRGLMMAADGYGSGLIQGTVDGSQVTISTEDSPVKQEVRPSEHPDDLLGQLMRTFRRIWERMTQ